MSKRQNNSQDIAAKGWFGAFEAAAFVLILSIAALRAGFIEDVHSLFLSGGRWITPRGVSLILTGGLAAILFLWFLAGVLQGGTALRRSGTGWCVLLFFAAGAVSIFGSSDKRTAITDAATLSVPMAAAWAAASMMNNRRRVRIVLWSLIATGCAATYQNIDQYAAGNDSLVEDYKADPQKHLAALGIEPNSLAQWQYEHRLYSKDVRGFMTTSNSTGSFLLLAVFAAAGFLAESAGRKETAARTVLYGFLFCILLTGLVICRSRGAIAAGCLSAVIFFALIFLDSKLWRRRRIILLCTAITAAAIISAVVWYGLRNGRLPGPNAMLVRWQYWVGAARMAAGHLFAGTGGGNFAIFYPQYKIAAASETVRDPHNFILSLLCQYGPAGLAAVLVCLSSGLWRALRGCYEPDIRTDVVQQGRSGIVFCTLAAVFAVFLFIRPAAADGRIPAFDTAEQQAAYIVLYVVQAVLFLLAFALMWAVDGPSCRGCKGKSRLVAGLVCGVIAVSIHNLIDFGIFEPGVWMSFWLVLAAAISESLNDRADGGFRILRISGVAARLSSAAALTLLFGLWLWFVAITPVRAQRLIAGALSQPARAVALLEQSGRIDALDPEGLYMAARLNLSMYEASQPLQRPLLEQARRLAIETQTKDVQNFRYSLLLGRIYQLFADSTGDEPQRHKWLADSYDALLAAQRLYPGSDTTAFSLGQLSEELGRDDEAVMQYRRAVEIERQYRRQFEQMYSGREVFSRLGRSRYEYALDYLSRHDGQTINNE